MECIYNFRNGYGYFNVGYAKTRFGLEYDYSAYNRVTTARTFIYRYYEQLSIDSREFQIRFFKTNKFDLYLGMNDNANASFRLTGQTVTPLQHNAFYSAWLQLQAGNMEDEKVVGYSFTHAYWQKSSPFSQEAEMGFGIGDYVSNPTKVVNPILYGPQVQTYSLDNDELVLVDDIWFLTAKYQMDYAAPISSSFLIRAVGGLGGVFTSKPEGNISNLSILGGVNFEKWTVQN